MGLMEDLKKRYAELDEVDRKNLWIAVAFVFLIILVILSLSNTAHQLGSMFSNATGYVNDSVAKVGNPTKSVKP